MTLFQALSSPIMGFPTTARSAKSSELQGPDPMVLVLSRGGFCPKEHRQHEGLVQLHLELEVAHYGLITITTDNIIETN